MKSEHVKITEEIKLNLLKKKEKIGWGWQRMLKNQRDKKPEGFTVEIPQCWIDGKAATARPEHLVFLNNLMDEIIRTEIHPVPVTEALIKKIEAERDRTGVEVSWLIKTGNPPSDIKKFKFSHVKSGHVKTAYKHHLNFILEEYRKRPDRAI